MTAAPQRTKSGADLITVTVRAIVPLNELVTRFEFERERGRRMYRTRSSTTCRSGICQTFWGSRKKMPVPSLRRSKKR